MEDIIRLEKISILSQNFEVLHKVSVRLPRGKSTIIMGPSGCGKSTLLKVAAGIMIPENGQVFWEEKNLLKLSEKKTAAFRKSNGFVFQDGALWANKSMFENLALPLQFYYRGWSRAEVEHRVFSLLDIMNLSSQSHLRPAQLSYGERKLVSFLRALVLKPSIIFMDEPTLSIDHEMRERMFKMIKELKAEGCSIITVTHDSNLISLIADYLVIVKSGYIIEEGNFEQVRRSTNPEVSKILALVLSEAATYDQDLLDLLNG